MAWFMTVFLIATGLLFLLGVPLSRKFRTRQNLKSRRGCQLPPSVPQQDPIFGFDLVLQQFRSLREDQRNTSLEKQFLEYGNTFRSKTYSTTRLFTTEPKNLQAVFSTNFSSWGVQPMRLFGFEPFVGKGIMCTDGSLWEHSRALIKPTFAKAQIADLHLSAFALHVQHLIEVLPQDGSTVDLQPLFAKLALDSSTEFLFGESVGVLKSRTVSSAAKSFLEAYNYGQQGVGRRVQLGRWATLKVDRRFQRSCTIAHDFVDAYIRKALLAAQFCEKQDSSSARYVLVRELVKETKDRKEIRNQLLNVFLPAHDATGVALTNVFFHLARHPGVYLKLRREIVAMEDQDVKWTFERIKSLKYLQYVIQETFRLNPVIGTNARMALEDTMLPTGGGESGNGNSPIFVHKGDIVTFSFYALHKRKDLFGEDADTFRPERWETLRPAHWSYLPFGGGPRICPGQQLALTEVGYSVIQIVKAFSAIENRDQVLEFVEHYKLSTESKNGAKVALIA